MRDAFELREEGKWGSIVSSSGSALLDDRTRALVERSRHLVAFVSPDGALLYLNESGRRMLGLDALERDTPLAELLAGESPRRESEEILGRSIETGEWCGESLFRDARSETSIPMEVSAFVTCRDESGVPVELAIEARDSRLGRRAEEERRHLESQLQQASKMEAGGRLAGGVAHDFNNLLTAMAGFSEILLDHFEPGHPMREGAEQTLETCQRSAGLIRQLLTVSRRQVLQPVVLDVIDRTQEMAKLLGGLIGEDIELNHPSPLVRADPAQIEQVLLNLVVNARDAMPGGGTLGIRTEIVELEELLLDTSDEYLEKPFTRAELTRRIRAILGA